MSGAAAVAGFVYQQDYCAFVLLASESRRLLALAPATDCVESFTCEGRFDENGEVWDMSWHQRSGEIAFRECKDTEITKIDRKIFYQRIKRELGQFDHDKVSIGWVTDPSKQKTAILQHFKSMRRLCDDGEYAGVLLDDSPPNSVTSGKKAFQEAIYWLTKPESDETALTVDEAVSLLKTLSIDEVSADSLSTLVQDIAIGLFESGSGQSIRRLIQGTLATKIQQDGSASLTTADFLSGLNVALLDLHLQGELRDIWNYYQGATTCRDIKGIRWTFRGDLAEKLWTLKERTPDWVAGSDCVIVSSTGAGKTTVSKQIVGSIIDNAPAAIVLRFEADKLNVNSINLIPRLALLLTGFRSSHVIVDGLDQIPQSTVTSWRQTIHRLRLIPSVNLILTARQEVLVAHDWLNELVSTVGELRVAELQESEIATEFVRVGLPAPQNRQLVRALRNPFLFSIYARTVTETDSLFSPSSEVSAFDVIEQYWRTRVRPSSSGLRAAGALDNVHEKQQAIDLVVDLTLRGERFFSMTHSGLETLRREGVLEHHHSKVKWSHEWLKEFALTQHVLSGLAEFSPSALAAWIAQVANDDAARTIAVGGAKYISSRHSNLLADYLGELERMASGCARDALSMMLEGSPNSLELASLTTSLLADALQFCIQMKYPQWYQQVIELPDSVFATPDGPELQQLAMKYELELEFES